MKISREVSYLVRDGDKIVKYSEEQAREIYTQLKSEFEPLNEEVEDSYSPDKVKCTLDVIDWDKVRSFDKDKHKLWF